MKSQNHHRGQRIDDKSWEQDEKIWLYDMVIWINQGNLDQQ